MEKINNLEEKDSKFVDYCAKVTRFCPFINPSINKNVLFQERILLEGLTESEIEAEIFFISLLHVEEFRDLRKKLEPDKQLLLCFNLIFYTNNFEDIDGDRVFLWPHYLLKLIYTEVGIMFGKFWVGEQGISRSGTPIDVPDCDFISIRSAIKNKDPYFLSKVPDLEDTLLESFDDGRDVLEKISLTKSGILDISPESRTKLYQSIVLWAKNKK
jgi:hypothetical protein